MFTALWSTTIAASSIHCLQNSVSLALVFRARMPSNMTASSLTPSSHRFLGISIRTLQLISYCRAFFCIRCSSILITCPAHCNILNFINSVTFISLYKSQISALYLILHPFSSCVGPKISLKIFQQRTAVHLSLLGCYIEVTTNDLK